MARDPESRLRDIASQVGLTERGAHRIVNELIETGYLSRQRIGRRNRYVARTDLPLRHPLDEDHNVGEVLASLIADGFTLTSDAPEPFQPSGSESLPAYAGAASTSPARGDQ